MKQILPNGSEFDSTISFFEQKYDCQDYFYNVMNSEAPIITNDSFDRPLIETWQDNETRLTIERRSVYLNDDKNSWALEFQTINIH